MPQGRFKAQVVLGTLAKSWGLLAPHAPLLFPGWRIPEVVHPCQGTHRKMRATISLRYMGRTSPDTNSCFLNHATLDFCYHICSADDVISQVTCWTVSYTLHTYAVKYGEPSDHRRHWVGLTPRHGHLDSAPVQGQQLQLKKTSDATCLCCHASVSHHGKGTLEDLDVASRTL